MKECDEVNSRLSILLKSAQDKLRIIYVARKSDDIDVGLAHKINSYPDYESIKVLFLRIQKGKYQFGMRKVGIELNSQGELIVI